MNLRLKEIITRREFSVSGISNYAKRCSTCTAVCVQGKLKNLYNDFSLCSRRNIGLSAFIFIILFQMQLSRCTEVLLPTNTLFIVLFGSGISLKRQAYKFCTIQELFVWGQESMRSILCKTSENFASSTTVIDQRLRVPLVSKNATWTKLKWNL